MSSSFPPEPDQILPFLDKLFRLFQTKDLPSASSPQEENDPPPIQDIFQRVVPYYDLMNDVMSASSHRLWKDDFVSWIRPSCDEIILDLASGTGDIARRLRPHLSPEGRVIECDLSFEMLTKATEKAYDMGDLSSPKRIQADALALPFPSHFFDKVSVAFGLRNIPNLHQALLEIHRVLKPKGTLFCLEFSHSPWPELSRLYNFYSSFVIPYLGDLIANDKAAYAYLVQSIQSFPTQQKLCHHFEAAHFTNVGYENRLSGLLALHRGSKAPDL